jgi:hypothetical protein
LDRTELLAIPLQHWVRKDRLLRVDAINAERNGAGVPLAYAPPNAKNDQIAALSNLARSYRAGESAGGALPNGSEELRERCLMSLPASGATTSRLLRASLPCSPSSVRPKRARELSVRA